jgi:hypothetical protein
MLSNLGSSYIPSSPYTGGLKYSFYINSDNVLLNNVTFSNICRQIFDYTDSALNLISNIKIIGADVTKLQEIDSEPQIIKKVRNIENIYIRGLGLFSSPTACVFSYCSNIKGVFINDSGYVPEPTTLCIFKYCKNISNVEAVISSIGKLLFGCDNINNFIFKLETDLTPFNTQYLIENCRNISNYTLEYLYVGSLYNKYFKTCSYLNNIISTDNPLDNDGATLTKVDPNTVSW